MAINLATKYSAKVDERFTLGALTGALVNNDYEWNGVNAITVYSIDTVTPTTYTKSGLNRFGTPAELGDTIQTYTLTQDLAFTFVIDKGNDQDQMGVKNAGTALAREINEEIIPAIDKYRIGKMVGGAGNKVVATITKANAYETVLNAIEELGEDKVPQAGRVLIAPYAFFSKIRLDDAFMKNADLAQEKIFNGQVGTIEGMPVILAPSNYFPADTNFVIAHPSATVAPVKLTDYRVQVDPVGVSGAVVEGRVRHDAFVLDQKVNGICLCATK